jgi:glyoxylase-like metal-dependent hydrolase (beta-lactamase superfamily II)
MDVQIDTIRTGITNSYVLRGEGTVLVDPGEPGKGPALLRRLARVLDDPSEIGLILATHGHYDHIGAAPPVREALNAKLAIHGGDAGWARAGGWVPLVPTTTWSRMMFLLLRAITIRLQRRNPVDADIVFDDAGLPLADYGIPGTVVPTPGHTPGSVSILLDGGDAVVGDLAMSGPPLVLEPSLAVIAVDPELMLQSWLHLVGLGAETIYPAHGKPFRARTLHPEPSAGAG